MRIWAVFGIDEDGEECFACGVKEDGTLNPMITNTEKDRDSMIKFARELAKTQGRTLRLVRFDHATVEEEINGKAGGAN